MRIDQSPPWRVGWETIAIYLKAASFLAPPLFIWTVITIWVTPKMKQLCADADARPFAVFKVIDFAQDNALILAFTALAIIILLEWNSALWRRWRKYSVGTVVFLINTAVIFGLACLLLIASIAAPMLVNR